MKMKQKRFILLLLSLFLPAVLFLTRSPLHAEDDNMPDWLKRIEYSVEIETDKKPSFYFQTVHPLYQDADKTNTFFIQPRASVRSGRGTYNLGLGYRKLISDDWLLGVNTFLDYQDLHRHSRAGIGLEALGQIFEARLNSYFAGLSNKQIVIDTGASQTIERVVDGGDLEIGAPLPYAPWLKLYGSGFWYDYKEFNNKYGWKTRLEAKLNDALRLEFYSWDDNKGDTEFGGRVRFQVAFHSLLDLRDAFKRSEEAFPEKDLKEETLIPVERNFEITIEKAVVTGGLTVEAGRS